MEKYINLINDYFQGNIKLEDAFSEDAYIRLNMLYLCPVTIQNLKKKLDILGMQSWLMDATGITFTFDYSKYDCLISKELYEIRFKGDIIIHHTKDNKIYSFELDFDPLVEKKEAYHILYDIESFLKGCDAVFFMCNDIDIDNEILSNPLANSVEYLYKRIEENSIE
ncbi:hypothetical protein BDAP_000842 [Binucleata daphniae]